MYYCYTFILVDYKNHLVTGLKSQFTACAAIWFPWNVILIEIWLQTWSLHLNCFPCFNHRTQVERESSHNSMLIFSRSALFWFISYLAKNNDVLASLLFSAHTLITGVPQGSVLGPLMFSIYTVFICNIFYTFLNYTLLCGPHDIFTIPRHSSWLMCLS